MPPEEDPMNSAAHDAAIEKYFHQEHRERHHKRARMQRRALTVMGATAVFFAIWSMAGAFGKTSPWYLIKVSQLAVSIDVAWIGVSMIFEAVRGGRRG